MREDWVLILIGESSWDSIKLIFEALSKFESFVLSSCTTFATRRGAKALLLSFTLTIALPAGIEVVMIRHFELYF